MKKHEIKALILDEKKRIAKDMIAKLKENDQNEGYKDATGNLRHSYGYIEKDGKIVIYKGMGIIQIL